MLQLQTSTLTPPQEAKPKPPNAPCRPLLAPVPAPAPPLLPPPPAPAPAPLAPLLLLAPAPPPLLPLLVLLANRTRRGGPGEVGPNYSENNRQKKIEESCHKINFISLLKMDLKFRSI